MADLYVCSHGNTKPCDECKRLYAPPPAPDATPERIWLQRGQAKDPSKCALSHISTDGNGEVEYVRAGLTTYDELERAVIEAAIEYAMDFFPRGAGESLEGASGSFLRAVDALIAAREKK